MAVREPGTTATAEPEEAVRPTPAGGIGGWRAAVTNLGTFDSLRVPAYRWFFFALIGQMSSANMQQVVRGYLVYLLTGSYAALGAIALANAVPGILLSLSGGTLADRVRQKKHIVQAGQLGSAAIALAVALLLVADRLTFESLFIASACQGAVQALMMPARQAMIPEVVEPRRLMNAVALASAGQNSVRVFAPGLGGFVLALFAPRWVYFIMTACYLVAALCLMRVPASARSELQSARAADAHGRDRRSGGIMEGLRYIAHDATLRTVLGVNIVLILCSMPYMFLLPGFVASELHGGPALLGMLFSAVGIGAVTAALGVASFPARRRGLMFLLSSGLQGVMLICFAASPWVWLTVPLMILMGVGQAGRQSFGNVLVQHYTRDEYRGRVMSVYMLQFALTSLGTFFVGLLAAVIGAPLALGGAAGVMVLTVAFCLVFVPTLRDLD